jgi:1A family penicillin-binding protein
MIASPRSKPASSPGWLRRHWNGLSPRGRKLVVGIPAGGFLAVLALAGVVYAATDIPLPEDVVREQSAIVTYADGSELGRITGAENRRDVPLGDVPEPVREAVLAAEDEGFYGHSGVSVSGIARAAFRNVRGGGSTQGGSTITQQYVKNAFLTRERTLTRKFKELVIAVKLDQKYDKDQILEFYLNTVYFGRGAYGIQAASREYFGKDAKALGVAEGALLATLIRSPESGDPARNPKLAQRRWDAVLDNMVEEKWLTSADRAKQQFPKVRERNAGAARERIAGQRGFIFEAIERELEAQGFDTAKLYTGVRVKTTLERPAQQGAEKAVNEVLPAGEVPQDLRTALVAVEPGTGRIRAMYGGRDFVQRQFNYATQATERQPGSSFKPYVLAAAIEDGISLRSRFDGRSPQTFGRGTYEVDNFGDEDFGRIDLVEATAKSVNTVYVKLAEEVGVDAVIETAQAAGIPESAPLPKDLSIALGSGGTSPLNQANAFATFAAEGTRATPFLVEEVEAAGGRVIYRAEQEKDEGAIAADVSADVTFAMTQVVERGTARRAQLPGRPSAGKTGTTQDNTDAWFVGYTPQVSAAVWMGFDDVKRKLDDVKGRAVTGGSFPAEIWQRFMVAAHEGKPVKQFPEPEFVGRARNASASASPTSASPTPSSATPTPTVSTPSAAPTVVVPTSQSSSPEPTQEPEPTEEPTESPTASPPAEPQPTQSPAPQDP